MNITLLVGSLTGGGAERVVCNLANFLADKGHDVTILTVSDKKTYYINDKVKHIVLYGESHTHLPHSIINVFRLVNMNRYLRKARPDVYVTFLPKLTRFLLAQKRFVKCPIVLCERNDPKTFYKESVKNAKQFDKYFGMADGYIFQTEDAKQFYMEHGVDVSNSKVIPNAINPAFVRDPYTGEREKVIVSAGRLTEQKNFPILIQAFAKIKNQFPDHKLVIYGQGALLDTLNKIAEEQGVKDRVAFGGYVTNLGDMMQSAAMFVLSSNYEGMPNALMEAMALGLPVISTDCPAGGSRFLIRHEQNGLLVPVSDVNAMSNAMIRILKKQEFANSMGKQAHTIVDTLDAKKIYYEWEKYLIHSVNRFKEYE